ncbi:MAG: UDP-3-O-(3-hydroxymyristoyl)glucosamine N-acyltransferase [Roseovarius sp.]|nr:UDP-3-O-(3-hydroxymyristoyl)glucosamine N-acyltransferase [Roseovarius sp.]MCY4207130.1 UDP-3-O-(3-hydroxymyristoyl)glucosamine N-acyltransferase [Roseovarius sp.]
MPYTVGKIAESLGVTALGDASLTVDGAAEPAEATEREIALALKPEYANDLPLGNARAAILFEGADWKSMGLKAAIQVPRPRYAMVDLTKLMNPGQGWDVGIHPTAVVDDSAKLGEGVSVGPLSVICAGADIGSGTVIGPQSYIGWNSRIGINGFLREGTKIGPRVTIGDRFVSQPGAVIGGDGFSFVTENESSVERVQESLGDQGEHETQQYFRIHSLGAVSIGDDVEIGTLAAVDRGTIRDTMIGDRTKIDNLVHIGHNCIIGNDCLICGHTGFAGSARIGNNVVLGGQTGVNNNIIVGDNVIAGGGTKLLSNVPKGRVMLGYPAMKMDDYIEAYKGFRRLKRLFKDVAELKRRIKSSDIAS